jgi:hypothetical protein
MAARGRTLFMVLMLAGLVAATAGSAAAASSSPPVTLRGTATRSAAPADGYGASDGASIVLRGTTPPPTPSFAGFPCPPGYTYDPDTGCIVSGDGSGYASGTDYGDDWYWPNDFGRRRPFRPHRHDARGFPRPRIGNGGFARGSAVHAMPAAHGFGGGHR